MSSKVTQTSRELMAYEEVQRILWTTLKIVCWYLQTQRKPHLCRIVSANEHLVFHYLFMYLFFLYLLIQAGIPNPPNMSEELIKQKARERHFLEQLLDSTKLENYKIPVSIKAELRKYQQVRNPCFLCLSLV